MNTVFRLRLLLAVLAPVILAHRIIVRPEQRIRGMTSQACVQEALRRVPIPVGLST